MSTEIVGAGWAAGPIVTGFAATGLEKLWGEDSAGNASEIPAHALRRPGVFNLGPASLPLTRKMLARVRSGQGRGRIVCLGSSETASQFAAATVAGQSPSTANANLAAYSVPTVLAKLVNSAGVAAVSTNFFSDNNFGIAGGLSYPTTNTAVAYGSGWSNPLTTGAAGYLTSGIPGGQAFVAAYNASGAMSFSASGVTQFDIYYLTNPSGASGFTYNIDGGAQSGVTSATGSAGISKITTTAVSAGAHVLNISPSGSSGQTTFIAGVVAYNANVPAIDVMNVGYAAGSSIDLTNSSSAWGPLFVASFLPADLYVLEIGVNDSLKSTGTSTFRTNLSNLVSRLKAVGDVLLVTSAPMNPGVSYGSLTTPTTAVRATYDLVTYALADPVSGSNLPLIDLPYRFGQWAGESAAGMAYDAVHPLMFGYSDIASAIANVVLSV